MGGELGDVEEDGTGEGGWERVEGADGEGDTVTGMGGIVVSIAFDPGVCLLAMSSEVMESLGSTWVSSSSLMNWYSLSPNIMDQAEELMYGRSSTLVATVLNQSSKTT